jgi:hypothetical protein
VRTAAAGRTYNRAAHASKRLGSHRTLNLIQFYFCNGDYEEEEDSLPEPPRLQFILVPAQVMPQLMQKRDAHFLTEKFRIFLRKIP